MDQRPARRDDLDAIVELFCRYEQEHRGAPDTDASDVTEDWDGAGFDLTERTRVLEDGGQVVGYAVSTDDGYCDAVVAPGVDVAPLLDWLESCGVDLEHYVPDADAELHALLGRRGWQPARRFWRMRRELDAALPDPVWPSGVELRDHQRPGDDRPVHALVTTCFREIGGQHDRTFEQWSSFLLDTDRFDPSLCLVALWDGEVVGTSLSQTTSDYGFVRQLAVAPSQRGRGLALALLHESFRRHAARGLPATVLGVDAANPTGALALYEKAGMRVVEQFTRWERPAAS